ncbi:MAG TPA: tetratricopeptide repeat protein, partial [Methanomethylovorans sp.]|nr:tetratricopeptide repeat protein [Methanomethylovorans sp.]
MDKKIHQLKESFTHKVDISDVDFEQFNTLPNTDIPPQIKKEFVSLCDYSRFATILDCELSAAYHLNCGIGFYCAGSLEEASLEFDEALKIDSNYANAWNNKAFTLAEISNYADALENYCKALQLDPTLAQAWNGQGKALLQLGKYWDALEAFEKATEIKTSMIDAWEGKGEACIKVGKCTEALEAFDKTLELKSDFAQAWRDKGVTLANL